MSFHSITRMKFKAFVFPPSCKIFKMSPEFIVRFQYKHFLRLSCISISLCIDRIRWCCAETLQNEEETVVRLFTVDFELNLGWEIIFWKILGGKCNSLKSENKFNKTRKTKRSRSHYFKIAAPQNHCKNSTLKRMETLAQVTGVDAVGIVNLIISSAGKAATHRRNCEQLAEHVKMIGNLLEKLKSTDLVRLPAIKEPLDCLEEALKKAFDLVESCRNKSCLYMLAMGWSVVYQFRQVQAEIDRYLKLVPLISLVHEFRMQV